MGESALVEELAARGNRAAGFFDKAEAADLGWRERVEVGADVEGEGEGEGSANARAGGEGSRVAWERGGLHAVRVSA